MREIPGRWGGSGQTPVDERNGKPLAEDDVLRRDVIMTNNGFATNRSLEWVSPGHAVWQGEICSGIMHPTKQATEFGQCCLGHDLRRGMPEDITLNVGEDLTPRIIDPQEPRCPLEACLLEMLQQDMNGRRPRPGGAYHHISTTCNTAHIRRQADIGMFLHPGLQIALLEPIVRTAPGRWTPHPSAPELPAHLRVHPCTSLKLGRHGFRTNQLARVDVDELIDAVACDVIVVLLGGRLHEI